MLDKLVSGIFGGSGGNFLTNLAANAITSKILGGDTKDALMFTALQQGLGSEGLNLGNLFGGGEEKVDKIMAPSPSYATMPMGEKGREVSPLSKAVEAISGTKNIDPVFKQGENTLGYAKFLVDAGLLQPDSKLASLLNSRVGEALATGLGSQLASKMFDKEEQLGTGMASRPFGGEGSVKINIPNKYAAGGYIDGQYFPRRNGGIMLSEGSGQKDDVPAMLMAGEFVLTKDAVKGLGNGDSERGIEKAYSMMNKLENKANNYG